MRKIVTSLMIIAVLAALITVGAMAVFTDQESSTNNAFTAGTVDIALTNGNPLPFSVSDMAPGDNVTGTLVIDNSGSLEIRSAMTTTADGASTLDEQLDCVITQGATTLYSGKLSMARVGNPSQGQQE